MPGLFSVAPANLFSPLAAPGAAIYADILLALFHQARRSNQLLSRERAVDLTVEQLDKPQALELTGDAVDALAEETAADSADMVRARAGAILRYFERCGWLRPEMQSYHALAFILPDYAFRLLETLDRIAANEPPPLRGLIVSIHDLLQSALRATDRGPGLGDVAERVAEAHRQTALLLNGLRELQHNIGLHINQVLQEFEARAILERVFINYRQEIVDRAYHQLRTTDHVSRFRPGILEAAAQIERLPALAPAAIAQVCEIRDRFEDLDRLLQLIDERHSQFIDAAARAIELQLTTTATTSGQLNAILKFLLAERARLSADALAELTHPLLSLYSLSLADEASLAAPTRAITPFLPEPVDEAALTPEEEQAAIEETLRQMQRAVSRHRVRAWAQRLLREHDSIRGAEIPLAGPDELPLLIYLRAYGQDGALGYCVKEMADGAWVEKDGVGFRDFLLRRTPEPEAEA